MKQATEDKCCKSLTHNCSKKYIKFFSQMDFNILFFTKYQLKVHILAQKKQQNLYKMFS
jgi:hypothetical protein